MRNLRRRVRRLESILLPIQDPPAVQDEKRRFQQLCSELYGRIDREVALTIAQENVARAEAKRTGKPIHFSNLSYGFYRTVLEHVQSDRPLEFPNAVAEAYAQKRDPGSPALVECKACRYLFPWGIANDRFEQCPVCAGEPGTSLHYE